MSRTLVLLVALATSPVGLALVIFVGGPRLWHLTRRHPVAVLSGIALIGLGVGAAVLAGWMAFGQAPREAPTLESLRVGDCVTAQTAIAVPCSAQHVGTVIAVYTVDWGDYVGEGAARSEAIDRCSKVSSLADIIYPTSATWAAGDRLLGCIDRVEFNLHQGDCVVHGTTYVEGIDCSRAHSARVTAIVPVGSVDAYPGQEYFQQLAAQHCPPGTTTFLFPHADNWERGLRKVACLDQSQ